MDNALYLEVCQRTNPIYQDIRNRHYVDNHGCQGAQIHFLINYNNEYCGIISGASSVYGVKARDAFFKIPKDQKIKQKLYLPALINNTVFRLENHEYNLGTKILKLWRNTISNLWEDIYSVPVIGFETFVVEEDTRKGCMYKADNWTYVGITCGSTKTHNGMINKSARLKTSKKLIYCKWIKQKEITPTKVYISSWKKSTPEEIELAKKIAFKKQQILGQKYYFK